MTAPRCRICGESDPAEFYKSSKRTCKSCVKRMARNRASARTHVYGKPGLLALKWLNGEAA